MFLRFLLPWIVCCSTGYVIAASPKEEATTAPPALQALADFPIGVAVPIDPWPNSLLKSSGRQALVERDFGSLTAENGMKMAYLRPAPGVFFFLYADALVAWAKQHGKVVHGHTLVWHKQLPEWLTKMEGDAETFRGLLQRHIRTVAGHFAGELVSWDVVNEAFTDDTPSTYRDTVWYRNIGPAYLELAYREARAADPHAELYYNDYDISGAIGPQKLGRILEMVDDFLARQVPIDGIGFQMHIDTDRPTLAQMREAFGKVVRRGLKVRISELDVSVNQDKKYPTLTPALEALQKQRYADVVRTYLETVPPKLRGGITVWGLTDGDSWIPGFKNRADWPLLFDAEYHAKPALDGFAEGLQSVQRP